MHRTAAGTAFTRVVLAAVVLASVAATDAGAQVKLAPFSGPPTTATQVSGKGYEAGETVDIAFDLATIGATRANQAGSFRKRISVPATALPGPHSIRATGESSGLSATAVFTVRTDWTRFHFDDANTGVNPYENVLGSANVSGLTPAWIAPVGRVTSSPAIVDGVVYTGVFIEGGCDGALWALDASTGAIVWEQVFPCAQGPSNPTVVNGDVYIGTLLDHTLRALDAATGVLRWSFAGGTMGTPAVSGNSLFVATNSSVYGLSARNGSIKWTALVGKPISADALALAGEDLVVGSTDTVYALDQRTGSVTWTQVLGSASYTSPAVAKGIAYLGTLEDGLYALDAATGVVRWQSIPTGGAIVSSPAVTDSAVYVGSSDGNVYAFDVATGEVLWATPTAGAISYASPVVANGVVYIGSQDHKVYAMEAATGAVLWSYETGDILNDAPALADGVLYVGSFDGNLYAFTLP